MSKKKFQLFRKRNCTRPTLLGWVIILLFLAVIFRLSLVAVYYFLAVNNSVNSKTLVLEGFAPTYVVKDALKYYKENEFDRLIVTGIPIVNYEFIAPYKNTALATMTAIRKFGFNDTVYIADIPTNILIDRTYNTAVATKMLFDENNWPKNFDIYSVGVHARRSRMMFRKVFGSDYDIGIISHQDRTFDPNHWWRNSKGFRNVSNEFVATLYVMMFFHPDFDKSKANVELGNYIDSIQYSREDKYTEFTDSTSSRFNAKEREDFHELVYFKPDINYKIEAQFVVDTTVPVFEMKTTTSRTPTYRTYGYLDFVINDTSYRLTAFQNMAYKDNPIYGGSLFVPFKDLTNTISTYGGGRYIDIPIPISNHLVLDFNEAYNPYCAYFDRWSCPVVPFENHLDVEIQAGEKKYK
ncbi:MAG TPA: DUF1684 domain-containing protein [Bacteroidales bacterium]|jgi:hypothetical protein|nr:DUF1684 domain-containing protein [Bacteroidales bacterium]